MGKPCGYPRDACGIFGIFGDEDAVVKTYYGLYSLQHRGQESAGIASADGKTMKHYRGMGLVVDVFTPELLADLANPAAIGHVRYSTTGSSNIVNAQPMVITYRGGQLAVAHNGNITNSREIREEYEGRGSIFQTTNDSEVLLHLISDPAHYGFEEALVAALNRVKGAFSFVMLTRDAVIGARDPGGFKPLVIGKNNGGYCLASETCALDLIHAEYVREVEAGEIVIIDKDGLRSIRYIDRDDARPSHCVFEHIYFARPDSIVFGDTVHVVRKRLGARLAKDAPVDADIVIAIPDSGNSAALGYAEESGIPLEAGFIRNHYVGRTFISPEKNGRSKAVEVKLNVVREAVAGKRIVVVEDSIVRGTTSRSRTRTLRDAGAKEIHMRISCPPHRYPCFYGIDFPTSEELIANRMTVEEIARENELDSLAYLSAEGMLSCVSYPAGHYCTACFTGDYPVKVRGDIAKEIHERANTLPFEGSGNG